MQCFIIKKEKNIILTQIFNQSLKIWKIFYIRNKKAVDFGHMSHILCERAWVMWTKQAVRYRDGTKGGASSCLFLLCILLLLLLLHGFSIFTFQVLIRINILPVFKPEILKTKLVEDVSVSYSFTTHQPAWLRNALVFLVQGTVSPLKGTLAPFLGIYEHFQSVLVGCEMPQGKKGKKQKTHQVKEARLKTQTSRFRLVSWFWTSQFTVLSNYVKCKAIITRYPIEITHSTSEGVGGNVYPSAYVKNLPTQ